MLKTVPINFKLKALITNQCHLFRQPLIFNDRAALTFILACLSGSIICLRELEKGGLKTSDASTNSILSSIVE